MPRCRAPRRDKQEGYKLDKTELGSALDDAALTSLIRMGSSVAAFKTWGGASGHGINTELACHVNHRNRAGRDLGVALGSEPLARLGDTPKESLMKHSQNGGCDSLLKLKWCVQGSRVPHITLIRCPLSSLGKIRVGRLIIKNYLRTTLKKPKRSWAEGECH